jgi:tetratricopeptide (TPR) repeat protein
MPEAQNSRLPPGAVVQPLDGGPGAELRRNLSSLAQNPRSIDALIDAGRAALNLRDAEAASGFFTRADQIAPGAPRAKAGLASTALLNERPEQALILFAEAVQRGAPVAEIAGDRGLAYDMVGDPRHAQQDYTLALRRRADPEIERRLALSLAISGQRDAALRVIDGQLRRQDRAGWRTQAFVLALTGDAAGADDTARRMMSATNAQALSPFFARLASLTPAQKAAAVNFGRFPSAGGTSRYASNGDTSADPGALAMAQGSQQRWAQPQSAQPQTRPVQSQQRSAQASSYAQRRRPGADEERVGSLIRRPREDVAPAVRPQQRVEIAQARPSRFAPTPPPPNADDDNDNGDAQTDQAPAPANVVRPREAPAFVPGGNFTLDQSREQRRPEPPVQSATPGFGFGEQSQVPSVRRFESVTTSPSQAEPLRDMQGTRPAFSDIANTVRTLPNESGQVMVNVPLTAAERQARDAAAREAEARYRSGGASPSAGAVSAAAQGRHWVQIAHGSVRSALGLQYRQVHAQAPGLIESHGAWTVADRSTNRLLIGPFETESGAQAFIDQLSQRQIAAIPWTSSAGQSVDRLQGGGAPAASPRVRETRQPSNARAGRNRQPEEAETTSASRRGSSSRSGRAAAITEDRATSRNRSGRSSSASDERSTSRSRSGRAGSASDDRATSRSRSGRTGATDERGGANGRSARDRAGTRSGRTGASEDSRSTARSRSGARQSSANEAGSSSRSRSTGGRASTNADSQASRSRSSQQNRPSANVTRNSRGRSSEEQRPAPSRRRSN